MVYTHLLQKELRKGVRNVGQNHENKGVRGRKIHLFCKTLVMKQFGKFARVNLPNMEFVAEK